MFENSDVILNTYVKFEGAKQSMAFPYEAWWLQRRGSRVWTVWVKVADQPPMVTLGRRLPYCHAWPLNIPLQLELSAAAAIPQVRTQDLMVLWKSITNQNKLDKEGEFMVMLIEIFRKRDRYVDL